MRWLGHPTRELSAISGLDCRFELAFGVNFTGPDRSAEQLSPKAGIVQIKYHGGIALSGIGYS